MKKNKSLLLTSCLLLQDFIEKYWQEAEVLSYQLQKKNPKS